MADMGVALEVPAEGRRSGLLLRPWLVADMSALISAMRQEYPAAGLWPNPDVDSWAPPGWTGPRNENEADTWLDSQDRGWRTGEWLTFVVLERDWTGRGHHLCWHSADRVCARPRQHGLVPGRREKWIRVSRDEPSQPPAVAHGRAHPRSLNAIGRRCQTDRFATGLATPPVPLRGPSPDTACHAGDMFESPQVGLPPAARSSSRGSPNCWRALASPAADAR
jgi:hypothetical protein